MTPLYLATEDQLSEAVGERLVTEANQGLQLAVCMGRKGNAYLRQKLPELAALSNTIPVLMLTDLDRGECAPALIADWCGTRPTPQGLLLRVAVREVESWLLADREGFAQLSRAPLPKIPNAPLADAQSYRSKLYVQSAGVFSGDKQYLAVQLIRLVEQFLSSDKRDIPSLWHRDATRRRILVALNMDTVVAHVSRFLELQNATRLTAVYDQERPIGSTASMRTWYTSKPCAPTAKSQISHAVYDSVWEKAVSDLCETEPQIAAWAKNDHLDFKVRYLWRGSSRNFVPDYLIRLANGRTLVLEVKGQDSEQVRAKRAAMQSWVQAVNEQAGFGQWCFDVVFEPAKTRDVVSSYY